MMPYKAERYKPWNMRASYLVSSIPSESNMCNISRYLNAIAAGRLLYKIEKILAAECMR